MSALAPPRIDSVPSCSRYSSADYDESRAVAFDPRDPTYLQGFAPSTVGGFVLGAVCAAAAIALGVWLIWVRMKKLSWKHELQSVAVDGRSGANGRGGSIELPSIGMGTRVNGGANAQMTVGRDPITNGSKWGIEDESDSDSDSAEEVWGSPQLRGKAAAALVLLTAAAVGTCVWAVVVSSRNVNTEADRFWAVIGDARDQVTGVLTTARQLQKDAQNLRDVFSLAGTRLTDGAAQLPEGVPDNTTSLLQQSALSFDPVILTSNASIDRIQIYGLGALDSFEQQFRGETQRAHSYRLPIVFAVCYSVAVVLCVALGSLALRGRQPRVLGCGTIALWLVSAFVLLFGAGVLHGSATVTEDACLYAEALAFEEAERQTTSSDDQLQRQLDLGLRYYFGVAPLGVHLVAGLVYGLDFDAIKSTLAIEEVQQASELLNGPDGAALLGVNSTAAANSTAGSSSAAAVALLRALPGALQGLPARVDQLADQINVVTIGSLYKRAKEVLCCEWSDNAAGLFVAWTASSVCLLVLCAALSARLYSLVARPGRRNGLRAWLRPLCW